ncbi:2-haloalkanoic acid dehalogenase-related protein [hydrothermal vent metagenome]|uniref:2-haloalkanoic acid dehalogenase-related protein n=1 Tax=hydrothermal vent metagenome TaxID=652676 RepID=A0A3B0UML2_9ZZZZ
MIKAITFDFWDTLVFDDSDEPKRAAQGLPSKMETRLQLLTTEIQQRHPTISPEKIEAAFVYANGRYYHYWKSLHVTPTTAAVDRDSTNTKATAVCTQFSKLPTIIEQIE